MDIFCGVFFFIVSLIEMCACVCVCVRERERERESTRAFSWPFAPWEGFQRYFHECRSLSRDREQRAMAWGLGGGSTHG